MQFASLTTISEEAIMAAKDIAERGLSGEERQQLEC
jgi:hypothetical protein